MTITSKIKALITGRTDPERLGEIADQIAAAEAELERLGGERRRYIVPRLAGDPDALKLITEIDRETEALHARLTDLRQAKGEIEARLARARQAAAAQEDLDRRRRIAEKRRGLFETVRRIDAAAAALAAEMKTALAEVRELAQAADSEPLRKWAAMLPAALRNGITPLFDIDPAAPKRAANNLLGLVSSWVGDRAHWPAARFAEEMLDIEAAVFEREEEAAACRERLAARGNPAFVVKLDEGLFYVVPTGQAFATRAEAETATRSVSMFRGDGHVLVPWQEGWLILPRHLAAALPSAEAA